MSKIKLQRISSDGFILEDGFLDLKDLKFHPIQMILSEKIINVNCPECFKRECNCPKPIK